MNFKNMKIEINEDQPLDEIVAVLERYYVNYVSVDNNSVWRILSPEESIVLSND